MTVHRSVVSQWVNGNNEIQVQTGAADISAIEIQYNPAMATAAYVRLWNVANPTPGTTEPDLVVFIPASQAAAGATRVKVIFGGGIRFDTALSYGVYTTPHSGSTAASGTGAPLSVQVFYT